MKFGIGWILAGALWLAATFEAQAQAPLGTTYNGLFYEANGYWEQSAGLLSLKTTKGNRFSGRLQVGPRRYSISGAFDANGSATLGILRRNENPLTLYLQVDAEDADLIYGTLSDGVWVADVIADRAVFNGKDWSSPDAGQYTMLIPGDFNSRTSPGGDSYGTVKVDRAGRLRFAGALADGTKVTQSSTVSKGGQWPFYASLYSGGGAIWGWVLLNNSAEEALVGDVTWVRPRMRWTQYYPEGFAITTTAWGSHYVRPPGGARVIDLTEGLMEFNGGNLPEGITNRVILEFNNRVTNLSPNGLKVSFSLSNGTFSGRVMHPVSWEWIRFSGVVLQDYAVAAGYFLDWTRSGEVWLEQPRYEE